jgi:hypothetical protein
MKSRDDAGSIPLRVSLGGLFAARNPPISVPDVPIEGSCAELFTGELPHIGTMQRSMPSASAVFLAENTNLHGGPDGR